MNRKQIWICFIAGAGISLIPTEWSRIVGGGADCPQHVSNNKINVTNNRTQITGEQQCSSFF